MGDNETNVNETTIIFRLDNDTTAQLDQRAAANDRTRSGELRAIVKAALGVNTAPAHAGA